MPGRIRLSLGGHRITPFFTAHTLLDDDSVRKPLRNNTQSSASCWLASCLSSTAPSSDVAFTWQRSQRKSSRETQEIPFSYSSREGVESVLAIMKTVGAMPLGGEKSRLATPRVTWM